jgi:anti-sigma28 factor (negative regulator of flagellin synthesis)
MSDDSEMKDRTGSPPSAAPRKRGLTSVTLQWLAEKFRRAQRIKSELSTGKYQIDSDKVARAILNTEGEHR